MLKNMNLQKKNRIFRSLTIVAFVLGILLVCNFSLFFSKATAKENTMYASQEELLETNKELLVNGVRGVAVNYYLYVAAVCLAFVLSIRFADITGKAATVLRTIFMGIAALCSFGGMVIIRALTGLRRIFEAVDLAYPETYNNVDGTAEKMIDYSTIETAAAGVLLVMVSVSIFFVLAVTAGIDLVKKMKKDHRYRQH